MSRPANIGQLVDRRAQESPDLNVLTCVDVGAAGQFIEQRRTFAGLRDNGQRLAQWLLSQGVRPGDRIALMLHNHPEFVEAMIAAAYVGAVFVPIDPRSVGTKLVYMLNFVEARLIIAGGYAVDALLAVESELTHAQTVLLLAAAPERQGRLRLESYASALPASGDGLVRAEPRPHAPMFMMFTSGTTGNPKAVVRTHEAYIKSMKGLKALGVRPGDVLYTGLPLSHINAHSTLAAGLSLGLPVVLSRRFTKTRLWDICRAYHCTVFTLLGGMIPEIYSLPETAEDADNPVRLIITSGMPAALWSAYRRRFGVEITEVYGSTEAGGVLINLAGEGPPGAMGKPPPGLIAAVLDSDGRPCPPHQQGELCFRQSDGQPASVGYFRNDDASRKKTEGGWFRSGDIAHTDEDGWFYFDHRAGGGVRRNGDFVNTSLVEAVVAQSPFVSDVYVYGVTTPANVASEQTLVASVVLRPGATIEQLLQAWVRPRLQKNEVPEIWQVLDAIPKTVSEKPIRAECIRLLEQAGLIGHGDEDAVSRTHEGKA